MLKLHPFFLMSILAFGLFSCSSTEPNQIKNEIVKAKKIPLEDFFKNPEKSSYQISPNGNYYSYMAPYKNRMNIFVQKIGDTSAVQLTYETDRDISGYFWPNDDQIMF